MDESCDYIFGDINSIQSSISNNVFEGLLNQNINFLTSIVIFITIVFVIALNSYQQRLRSRIDLHEKAPNDMKIDKDEF